MLYYLGLDASSTAIGIAILDEQENLILSSILRLKSNISLEQRAFLFEQEIKKIYNDYKIEEIFLEEPMIATFGGSGSAKTTCILNTISGMYRYSIFKVFNREAKLLNVRSIRSQLGIKFAKGLKGKEKKQQVINFVSNKYKEFQYKLTKNNNYVVGTDDRADAIIIVLGGIKKQNGEK